MMGRHDGQKELLSFSIDLEERIRKNHPLRKVAQLIDFGFIREEVKDYYGNNGNESVDPEILLKLMFLLFYENVVSERALMNILPERLDWLWFLRMGLDDTIPNHSVLSKARARWGEETFENFFLRIVTQCVEAGLVEGSKIYMDGSLIDADASKDSVVKAPVELMDQLREVYQAEARKLEGSAGQPNYKAQNDSLLSTTDPDAPMVRNGKTGASGDSRPRYKQHRAVDDAHGVITAIKTTPGTVEENREAEGLIDQHEHNTGKKVGTAVGDKQYGTVDIYRTLQKRGIKTHMGELHGSNPKCYEKIYGPEKFRYEEKEDVYYCPAGETLHPRRYHKRRKVTEYLTRKGTCDNCPLREQCTKAKHGRSIARHHEHEWVERGRNQAKSRQAGKDLRRRKHLIEGSFADAARHHFKRSRWRRLTNQKVQDFIIASVQNIKIIIKQSPPKLQVPVAMGLLALKPGLSTQYRRFCAYIASEKPIIIAERIMLRFMQKIKAPRLYPNINFL
jgi:transposase